MVERLEQIIDPSLSKIDYESSALPLSKRRWELYIGFLYGQPIWIRSEQFTIEEDFRVLAQIWEHMRCDDTDIDAADAAMDAMREMVMQHGDALSRPFNITEEVDACDFDRDYSVELLMDFMVYGQSGSVFGKWYDAYVEGGDSGCLDQGLADRFSEKADAKSENRDLPDLMERCTYHFHSSGKRCYLNK